MNEAKTTSNQTRESEETIRTETMKDPQTFQNILEKRSGEKWPKCKAKMWKTTIPTETVVMRQSTTP